MSWVDSIFWGLALLVGGAGFVLLMGAPMIMAAYLESRGVHTNPYCDPRDCNMDCWSRR
jgi:hypothetical protein